MLEQEADRTETAERSALRHQDAEVLTARGSCRPFQELDCCAGRKPPLRIGQIRRRNADPGKLREPVDPHKARDVEV